MSLTFRKMTADDFPACAEELIAAFREEPWCEIWTPNQAFTRIDEIMSARVSRGIVCVDGDRCVSMLCGRIMTYQDQKLFYIDEFSVHPQYQRQGIGSRMLASCGRSCKRNPSPSATCPSSPSTASPALPSTKRTALWSCKTN